MTDATLGSEVGYSTNSDKEEALSHNGTDSQGQKSSNDSVIDNNQVKEAVMKVEEEKKEAEKEKEQNEEEERQKENREPRVNKDRLNNKAVTDIEDGKDFIERNNYDNDKDKNNEDSVEQMNPPGWEKAYEIRIDILKQEINETEKKHELWQDKINGRKEEALKRWEVIKKKKQDRLKAQHRLHAVMDSVLNKDDEETMKEESKDI